MKEIKLKDKSYTAGKIVCVGRNYAEHARELGNVVPEFPIIFLKPSSSIIFSGENIVHPTNTNDLQHEAELVLLIGKDIKNAGGAQAEDAIAGYAIGLDMTMRDVQAEAIRTGHPWTVSKCFDTSAVLSEFVSSSDYKLTMDETITLKVNGAIRQNCLLNKMIFPPVELVKDISSLLTLEKGDLIFTGTPSGVSKVNRGDKIEAEITNIGKLITEII
jgi:5-carboxymethyl-2-hydroxymuconate isomerase